MTEKPITFTVTDDRPGYLREIKVSKKTGRPLKGWVRVLALNARTHWTQRQECMQKDIAKVAEAVGRKPAAPFTKAHVTITLYVTTKRRRDAQMLETCKGVLDGLTQAGVIADDSLDVIGTPTLVIEQAKEYGYAVTVTPIDFETLKGVSNEHA